MYDSTKIKLKRTLRWLKQVPSQQNDEPLEANIQDKHIDFGEPIFIDNNNIFCENLTHPHFYTNHNEEIQVKNILYLIEGLFLEENLIDDFNLIKILDRDGYASLTDLEKHPQLINFKIKMKDLKIVFLEHRINEITETVETFDDILIRNKDWKNIGKQKDIEIIIIIVDQGAEVEAKIITKI